MSIKNKIICLALLIFSQSFNKVNAWSEGGHRVIALLAYETLSPYQRTSLTELLRHHPRFHEDFELHMPLKIDQSSELEQQRWIFTQAAIWPDLARTFQEPAYALYHRSRWHHINLPVFLNEASAHDLRTKIKTNQQMEWREGSDPTWNNAAQSIDMAIKNLHSSSIADAQKALMLCWLIHLVGDIHQPLHCVSLFSSHQFPNLQYGDMGGNEIPIAGKNPLRPQTLHSIWDGLLGYDSSMNDLRARASRFLQDETQRSEISKYLAISSIPQWIEEGRQLAATYAYSSDVREKLTGMKADSIMPVSLSENYLRQAGAIARLRACVAGQRLAKILSERELRL